MSWWWWSFLDTSAGQLLDNAAVFTAFCPAADFPRPSNRTPSPIRRGSSIRTEPASLLPVHRGPGRQEGVPESLVLWCAEVESGGTTTPNAAKGDDGVADGARRDGAAELLGPILADPGITGPGGPGAGPGRSGLEMAGQTVRFQSPRGCAFCGFWIGVH
jgi:hypothetical protein